MMFILLEALIRIVGFSLAFYGLWLLVGSPLLENEIRSSFRNWKRKRKIKRLYELNNVSNEEKEPNFIMNHLEKIINAVSKKETVSPFNFIILIILIFTVSFSTLYTLLNDLVISTISSLLFAFLPYLFLRLKLLNIRIRTQFAFLNEFHTILQNYHSTNKDIYYTMENAIKDTEDQELKHVYRKLFSSLQKDRGNKAFTKAVHVFSFTVNSTHAKRFAMLLLKAQIDRADISLALNDLNRDIKKRQQDIQKEKTIKLETILMGYFPIILLPLLFFCAYRISGIRDFWYYFQQKTSITLFIITMLMSIVSVLTAYILSKPRADI